MHMHNIQRHINTHRASQNQQFLRAPRSAINRALICVCITCQPHVLLLLLLSFRCVICIFKGYLFRFRCLLQNGIKHWPNGDVINYESHTGSFHLHLSHSPFVIYHVCVCLDVFVLLLHTDWYWWIKKKNPKSPGKRIIQTFSFRAVEALMMLTFHAIALRGVNILIFILNFQFKLNDWNVGARQSKQ